MRVQLIVDRVLDLGVQVEGSVLEVNDQEGERMLSAGQAIPAVERIETPERSINEKRTRKRKR